MSKPILITQGEDAIGTADDVVISTILGSCIAVCLWDPIARVGGINHLLLPEQKKNGVDETQGAVAMDRLINMMVPHGAVRRRLRAKLFGGSSMLSGLTDIGARNAEFGRRYLQTEGIPCDAESLGGFLARKLHFWPSTGIVRQKFVQEAPDLTPAKSMKRNDVEIF